MVQTNMFELLGNSSDVASAKHQMIKDYELAASCIIAASKASKKSSKEFLYSVGSYGIFRGELTSKQRVAAESCLRGIFMAS